MNDETPVPDTRTIESVLGIDAASYRRRQVCRIALLLVAVASAAAFVGWYALGSSTTASITYRTEPATLRDLEVTVAATGTVEPVQVVDISSELSGVVRTVAVTYNDKVRKGDILAELDVERRQAQRDRARASVIAAKARAREAQATANERALALQRLEELGRKGYTPQQDLDAARAANARAIAALTSAQADISVAEADLLLQETDLAKSYIRSPIDGVVLKRAVEPGQTVASSFQAPVLFEIAGDLREMRVEAAIDEADIGSLASGQEATFTVDAFPREVFRAVVREIYFAPETVEGVVTYKAILGVANDDLKLRPGMTATARIVTQDIRQALVLPNAALRYAPPKTTEEDLSFIRKLLPRMPRLERATENVPMTGERTVYVLRDNAPVAINIRTGASDGFYSKIEAGDIALGDLLIVDANEAGQ